MARFKVTATTVSYGYAYVEAEDRDEALEIASEMDFADFIEYDWSGEIEDAQEVFDDED